MDKTQLVTIAVTALITVIAKELVIWLVALVKNLSVINTAREKIKAIFTSTNRVIMADIFALLFYAGVLINFAIGTSTPTRLEILLIFGAAIASLFMAVSLIFHITKARRTKRV